MANEVYTDYWFEGDVPEGFSKLKYGDGPEEVSKLFDLELEQERWYVDDFDVDDKNHAHVNTWSAWYPFIEPWEKVAEKFGLKMTYFTSNEVPYWFYATEESSANYILYYNYEDLEEWAYGDYDYFMTAKEILKFLKDNEITEFKCIEKIHPDGWYNDDLLEEYTYDLETLKEIAENEDE